MSILVGLALLATAAPARAATISLGALSFDQFIPAIPGDPTSVGTNAFNIFNATGLFAAPADGTLPPNPTDPLSLLNANLLLTDDTGATTNVAIGTIAPGLLDDGAGSPLFGLQFADTTRFTSAVFTATLSALTFLVADGTTFQAGSADLLFTLSAGAGGFLVPNPGPEPPTGVEFLLSGEIVPPTGIPEPSTLILFALGASVVLCARAAGLSGQRTRGRDRM